MTKLDEAHAFADDCRAPDDDVVWLLVDASDQPAAGPRLTAWWGSTPAPR